MKKVGFLALALGLFVAACNNGGTKTEGDSTNIDSALSTVPVDTTTVIDTTTLAPVDTTKIDTVKAN